MKRTLFGLAGAMMASALLVAGCSSTGSSSSSDSPGSAGGTQELRLFTTGDVNIQSLWEDTLIPAFESEHSDITISVTAGDSSTDSASLSKLAASVDNDAEPDMDIIDAGFLPSAESAGLLLEVSTDTIANLGTVDQDSIPSAGLMPYRGSSVVLAYDSTTVAEPPATLEELHQWVAENPGRFTYNSPSTGGSGLGFVQAVLDSQMTAEQSDVFITGYDQEAESAWDPGFKLLAEMTPNVYQKTYPNGNQEVLDLLSSGAIAMTPTWSDMYLSGIEDGSIPEHIKAASLEAPGLPGGAAYLGIPVNSGHQEAALTFLNWLLEPEQQVSISQAVAGFPAIAVAELPAEEQARFEGLDTAGLQPFYTSESIADLNSEWSQQVP
ncbi:MAG: extracellular solute-binding protein [Arachnia sp.]